MKCGKCGSYSRQLGRCLQRKINPRTIKGGVEAADWMGLSYICVKSPLYKKVREKLYSTKPEYTDYIDQLTRLTKY